MADHDAEQTLVLRGPLATVADEDRIAHYLILASETPQQRLRIGPGGLTVGRHPDCEISRPIPEISRRHCRVEIDGEWALLRDLGSTNGTRLDGRQVAGEQRLRNGSRIWAGPLELRYECRDERDVEEEQRMAAELRRALGYVRAILPEPITEGPVLAEWWFVPSATLGGDALGYQYLDPNTLAGFLLDVSGHGIDSAMHAVNVANALRRRSLPGADFREPASVAARLNDVFQMDDHNGLMLTLFYFVYDLTTRGLKFCSAGHHAAFLTPAQGGSSQPLWVKGRSIGMLPKGQWQTGQIQAAPGSRLYVFSDGAFEITKSDGTLWSLEALRVLVEQGDQHAFAEAQRLYGEARALARPGPLADDFSALVLYFSQTDAP